MTKPSPTARCRCRARRTRCSVALVSLAVLACACSSNGSASHTAAAPVVATTSIWADIVTRTTCGRVEVASMIPPGTDAHSYEPSVQDADELRSAELIVANGLGLEDGLHDALTTARRDGATVLEVAPAVVPEDKADGDDARSDEAHAGEHTDEASEAGHDHGADDPHIWMDPELVASAVPVIADALAEVDSLGMSADELDRCAEEYAAELHGLTAEVQDIVSAVPEQRRKLVTNHATLGRFAQRFDFEVVGTLLPSTSSLAEANPRSLDELEATMRDEGVNVIFTESTGDRRVAEALRDRLGDDAAVVALHTESLSDQRDSGRDEEPGQGDQGTDASRPTTYVEMLRRDATLIADALG